MNTMLSETAIIKHKEIFKFGEVSYQRLDKPRGYFAYSYFNTAKMMFFM